MEERSLLCVTYGLAHFAGSGLVVQILKPCAGSVPIDQEDCTTHGCGLWWRGVSALSGTLKTLKVLFPTYAIQALRVPLRHTGYDV